MGTGLEKIKIAILTISTSCYEGKRYDESGDVIEEICRGQEFKIIKRDLVPDNFKMIKKKLKYFSDKLKADIILTTGGTGFTPYDITPEATREISERVVPGISEYIRLEGSRTTKRALLSRGISVLRKKSLIINLPGSPNGVKESLLLIIELFPHIVDMLKGKGH